MLLWLVVAVELVNEVVRAFGSTDTARADYFPLSAVGVAVIAVAGAVVSAFVLIRGRLTNDQAIWSLAVLALLVTPAVGALANTGLARAPGVSVTSPAVALSLTLAGLGLALGLGDAQPDRARRHLFALIAVVAWLNVLAVVAHYRLGTPAFATAVQGPDQLDAILTNPFSSQGRLAGLLTDADLLGVTMAIGLAFQVRYLAWLATRRRRLLATVLAIVAALPTAGLVWFSYTRWALAAVLVGLLVAALPWQRWRTGWAPWLLGIGCLLAVIVPVATGIWTGVGTTERRTLWQEIHQLFLTSPLFGAGTTSTPAGLPNGQNQLAEAGGQAGWFGIAVLATALLIAAFAGWRARRQDGKAGLAVTITASVVMGFAVVTPWTDYRVLPLAMVVLIATIATSLGLLASTDSDVNVGTFADTSTLPTATGPPQDPAADVEFSAGDADAGWGARGVISTALVVLVAALIIVLVS